MDKIKEQGLACVDKVEESEEQASEEQYEENQSEENEQEPNSNETEPENREEIKDEQAIKSVKNNDLTLKTIELNSPDTTKNIKSVKNNKNLKRNLALAGIVTFCVVFGGALFLSGIRKRKNEFN